MSTCWRSKYAFKKGDVVRVRKGHALEGYVAIVWLAFTYEQFGVFLMNTANGRTHPCTIKGKDLELARYEEPAINKERGMTFRQAIEHVLGRIQRWLTDSRHPNLPQRMR